jgi:hypothetical protein
MGTALAPERMGDLTTSAKDLWSTLDEAGTQDLASSLEKSLNSSLQFGPPLPQRKKKALKDSQEKERRPTIKKPTALVETQNWKVRSPSYETLKCAAEPPMAAWRRIPMEVGESLNLERPKAATREKEERLIEGQETGASNLCKIS